MRKIATFLLPLALLAGCASQMPGQRPSQPAAPASQPTTQASTPSRPATKPTPKPKPAAIPLGQGKASFYATRQQGRRTASGERLNNDDLTAAHRELPFGSRVKVTNLANARSVVVRINDRGPYGRGRIIDVSRKAAEQLGMLRSGTAQVKLTLE